MIAPLTTCGATLTPNLQRPGETSSATTSSSRDEAVMREQRLLTVEDNPVNQKVIRHQLRLLGFVSDFADDGLQGLDRWRSGQYGLVLTDLQMPKLDGLQMVAEMRREEAASGRPRTPVVALTANAMKGQAELCLAAGMDDYLTKPVSLSRLRSVLTSWLGNATADGPSAGTATRAAPPQAADPATPPGAREAPPAVDVSVLTAMIGDKRSVLERLLTNYLRHGHDYQHDLLAALSCGDLPGAGAVAHKFKSASLSVGAIALGRVCEQIEVAWRTEQHEVAVALAPAIASHWRQVSFEIESMMARWSAAGQDTLP